MSNERFWKRVDKSGPNGCWQWLGYRQKFGHGWLGSRYGLAHRYAWKFLVGPLADAECLLHHCDNPPCVNPSHLYIGTRADNARDKMMRGRVYRGGNHLSYEERRKIGIKASKARWDKQP